MEYRTLGISDIRVSAITLGCWPFATPGFWGPQDEAASVATLARIPEHANYLNWPKTFFHHRSLSDAEFIAMTRRIDA